MAYRVMIDAGHGGYDNGATYKGRREKDDTLRLALAVGNILANDGFDVTYTRTTDIYQNPNEKAKLANEEGVDLFISLHRNFSPVPNTYSGVETLIYNKGDIKEELGEEINEELEEIGFHDLGVNVRKNLAVLKRTKMPAALIEVGFINSDRDNELFDKEFDKIAEAIADGIVEIVEDIEQPDIVYYSVQVGLFTQYENALNLQYQLTNQGFNARIEKIGAYYVVLVGKYDRYSRAVQAENELKTRNYETLIIAL